MKHPLFYAFRTVTKPFIGTGLGRIRPVGMVYRHLARTLIPASEQVIQIDGFKIRVRVDKGRDIDGVAQKLIYDREYEPMTTAVFRKLLKPGMTVVDVGANIGYFTLLAASLVTKTGEVFAFEPDPDNYEELTRNFILNPQLSIDSYGVAISNRDDAAPLYRSQRESGAHSLVPVRPEATESIIVPTRTLDSLHIGYDIDLLKTDTEGNDYNVLLGAKELLARSPDPVVVVECWEDGLRAAGQSSSELCQLLWDMGFQYQYAIDEFRKKLVDFDDDSLLYYQKKHGFSINIVASRHDLTEELEGLF